MAFFKEDFTSKIRRYRSESGMEGLLVQIVRIDVLLHHSEDVFIEHSAWVKLWHEDRAWEILAFAPTFTYE